MYASSPELFISSDELMLKTWSSGLDIKKIPVMLSARFVIGTGVVVELGYPLTNVVGEDTNDISSGMPTGVTARTSVGYGFGKFLICGNCYNTVLLLIIIQIIWIERMKEMIQQRHTRVYIDNTLFREGNGRSTTHE